MKTDKAPSRWAKWSVWLWVGRVCVVGLLLADVSLGQPAPGLSGQGLVLLAGAVVAAVASLAYPALDRASERLRALSLAIGMLGGCLAALASPRSAALALPALVSLSAGTSLPLLVGAVVAACGLVTLGAGSIVVTNQGFSLLGSSLAVAGGLLAGLWRRQYVLRAEQAELVAVEAQRAREAYGRVTVLDERARIAREIHDVLAHTLGGLVVQLDAADAVLGEGGDPERGRQLVVTARRLAVEGLEETRRAITALRADPVALPEMLAVLTSGHECHGQVSYELNGTPRQLTPNTSLAVYRTAQEALANARKHAQGSRVAVSLTYEPAAVSLRVVDDGAAWDADGHALAATGGGYGLSGIKERAELLGGTLSAGPSRDGWVVDLRVPA